VLAFDTFRDLLKLLKEPGQSPREAVIEFSVGSLTHPTLLKHSLHYVQDLIFPFYGQNVLTIAFSLRKCLNPGMKFVIEVFKKSRARSQYAFAKELGVSIQSVQYILGVTATPRSRKSMDLRLLCKLRKASGMSWQQFGKLLDKEFKPADD
jgi:hypothetical protein